jgi:hypothetical protein
MKPKILSAKSKSDLITYRIRLKAGAEPDKQRSYPVFPKIQEQINAQVDSMQEEGIIEESNSPWSNPIFLIPKTDQSYRLACDMRTVNSLSKKIVTLCLM